MGSFSNRKKRERVDNPWAAEIADTGKAPVVAGLVIVAILLAVLAVWQFLSGAHDSFTYSSAELEDSSQESAEEATSATGVICVHVVGSVSVPGVYELAANARVADAVEAAGGFTEDADKESLNLARSVVDGEQIRIPAAGESSSDSASSAQDSASSSGNMIINGKVNINTADSSTLQTLSGIGASTAEKIIADRESNGPFVTIEDLKRVSGIGDKKYAALADSICVG